MNSSESLNADQEAVGAPEAKANPPIDHTIRRQIRYVLQKKKDGQWENTFVTPDLSVAANLVRYELLKHLNEALRLFQYDELSSSPNKDAKGLFNNIITEDIDIFTNNLDHDPSRTALEIHQTPPQDFTGQNLSDLDFSGQNLSGANFNRCRLIRTALRGCLLRKATFIEADLSQADLTDSDATAADFSCANLTGTKLVRTDLSAACLMQAEVYSADLTGAVITGGHLGVRHIIPAAAALADVIDPIGYS